MEAQLRILVIGLDGAGKSTMITKLRDFKVKLYSIKYIFKKILKQNEEIAEIVPTAFFQSFIVNIDQKPVKLIEISGLVK